MEDNLKTYSAISSMYICVFCLGNTIGPAVGGVSYDTIGFRWGSLIIIGLSILTVLIST